MSTWRARLNTAGIWALTALLVALAATFIGWLFFERPIRAVYCLFANCPYELRFERPGDEYGDDPYGPYN